MINVISVPVAEAEQPVKIQQNSWSLLWFHLKDLWGILACLNETKWIIMLEKSNRFSYWGIRMSLK